MSRKLSSSRKFRTADKYDSTNTFVDVTLDDADWIKDRFDNIDPKTRELVPDDISLKDLSELRGIEKAILKEMPIWINTRARARQRAKLRRLGVKDDQEAAEITIIEQRVKRMVGRQKSYEDYLLRKRQWQHQ